MSDQSYDRVRQQIKSLGLKHKGGGSYEKDGEYLPTKKGIAFSHKIAKQVIEAILDEAEFGDYGNQQEAYRNFKTN